MKLKKILIATGIAGAIITAVVLTSTNSNRNYYFSSSGNDAGTGSINDPLKTLSKLNAIQASLSAGDSVLFKRNETFIGALLIKKSGISYGAYGTGVNPIITSMVDLSGWTNTGNDIWVSAANNLLGASVNVVTKDGVLLQLGQYPNTGYLKYEGHNGNTALIDADLTTNYTGADVFARTKLFVSERRKIASFSSGGVINVSSAFHSTPSNGLGYKIINDIKTLDQEGEWYYNPSTKRVYLKSATLPENIQASTGNDLVTIASFSNIKFRDINFKCANDKAFDISGGSGIDIQNCTFQYVQRYIQAAGHTNLVVSNCTFLSAFSDGMVITGGDGSVISDNVMNNTFDRPGMGTDPFQGGYAIKTTGTVSIQRNRIINTGYIAIRIDGNNSVVENNFIDTFCTKLNDGSGIYTNDGGVHKTGQKIINNIVLNGLGAFEGGNGSTQTSGIYIDDDNSNNVVSGNIISNCENGIYGHRGHNNIFSNNTLYNNKRNQMFINSDVTGSKLIRSYQVKNNILFAKASNQNTLYLFTINNDIRSFGTFDSNYHCRPALEPNGIKNSTASSSGGVIRIAAAGVTGYYSLDSYRTTYSPYEANSKKSPKGFDTLRFIYNDQLHDTTFSLAPYDYIDAKGVRYKDSVTLKPFTSLVLIRDGGSTPPPGNNPPTVTITSPLSGQIFTAPAYVRIIAKAIDTDGSISKVEYYRNGTFLHTENIYPYDWPLQKVSAGSYTFTAKAYDNSGNVTSSTSVNVTVK